MKKQKRIKTLVAVIAASVCVFLSFCGFLPSDDPERLKFVVADTAITLRLIAPQAEKAFCLTEDESELTGVKLQGTKSALKQICDEFDAEIAFKTVYPVSARRIEDWINNEVERPPIDAAVKKGDPFDYVAECDGIAVDKTNLYARFCQAVLNGEPNVRLLTHKVAPAVTVRDLKAITVYRGGFTTSYLYSSQARKNNVRLALAAFDGLRVESGQEISFNAIVGERTEERGYQTAKIILNGEYIDGIGGGVCQASTTLYNALLLSGMQIVRVCPHSLAPHYVAPSRDAMVNSTWADLVWRNPTPAAVFLRVFVSGDEVRVEVYGQKMTEQYLVTSEVTAEVPFVHETKRDDGTYAQKGVTVFPYLVRYGVSGCESESYLTVVKDGVTKKTRLRKDRYLPINGLTVTNEAEEESNA